MRCLAYRTLRVFALATSVLLAACGAAHPDLARLYDFKLESGTQPPVIVIPGVLGSRLRDRSTGREVWPGPAWRLLFGRKNDLALHFDPKSLEVLPDTLEASGVFDQVLGQDFYGAILQTLESSGGYRRGQLGVPADPRQRNYYVLPYDWRQDNVVTARKLDALIEQIRADYKNPALKVDVVAHSMGGLITRYYSRYGTADVLDGNDFTISMQGAKKLNRVVLLGTPNLGSANSLHAFLQGLDVGATRIPTEVLATMPSLYQLFPHPLNNWLVSNDGKMLDRDLFDAGIWEAFEWSIFDPALGASLKARGQDLDAFKRYFDKRLERARRFVWSLSVPEPQSTVQLVVFGGDCTLTPARLVVEEDGGDFVTRLFPKDVHHKVAGVNYEALMLEPGDGQVTKPSLLARENLNPTSERHRYLFFPLAYSFFLCVAHDQLTGNVNFQDNLLNVLLSREQLWPMAGRVHAPGAAAVPAPAQGPPR